MTNYFKIAGIALVSSFFFFSCSSENISETNEVSSSKKSPNTTLSTFCDITGATVTGSGSAIVNAGSMTSYTYNYSSTPPGMPTIITWSVLSANPVGSITITGSGTSVSVTYASNFISGSISAYGTGGTAAACQSILNIVKSAPNCCLPTTTLSYICRGSGVTSLSGTVKIRNPNTCNNWSNITKIDFDITSGVVFSQTNPANGLNGLSVGTMYPPFNINLINSNGVYELSVPFKKLDGCLSEITCVTKIYYNNGCPPTVTEATGHYDF